MYIDSWESLLTSVDEVQQTLKEKSDLYSTTGGILFVIPFKVLFRS